MTFVWPPSVFLYHVLCQCSFYVLYRWSLVFALSCLSHFVVLLYFLVAGRFTLFFYLVESSILSVLVVLYRCCRSPNIVAAGHIVLLFSLASLSNAHVASPRCSCSVPVVIQCIIPSCRRLVLCYLLLNCISLCLKGPHCHSQPHSVVPR